MRIAFIHVPKHEELGWVVERAVEPLLAGLRRVGATVERWNVDALPELERRLHAEESLPLVWPNAYHIDDGHGTPVSLIAALERLNVDIVGSGATTLDIVLDKARSQSLLRRAGLPTPAFLALRGDEPDLEARIEAAGLSWPVMVKPSAASGSLGIDDGSICATPALAAERVRTIVGRHGGPMLIEDFLPGDDITVGALFDGSRWLLFPTWHFITGRPSASSVLGWADRLRPWSEDRRLEVIDDPGVREQITDVVPRVCRASGVRDVCRVDARLDAHGRLRVIEINGMPGLEHPVSELVHQVAVSDEPGLRSFDRLLATIATAAAKRCQRPESSTVEAFSYFSRRSEVVARSAIHGADEGPTATLRARPERDGV